MKTYGKAHHDKDAISRIGAPNGTVYGKYVATLDKNNSAIVEDVCNAVTDLRFKVGKNDRYIVNEDLIDLKLDKDPKPGDTAKTRALRGWVYFYTDFSNMTNPTEVDTRLLIKRKVIEAVREGISKYNESYREDNMVIKSCEPVMDRFQYGEKSLYVYFILEEERYRGDVSVEKNPVDIGNGHRRFTTTRSLN